MGNPTDPMIDRELHTMARCVELLATLEQHTDRFTSARVVRYLHERFPNPGVIEET